MKKGFTLIELLAVIVILAIIALIATPIILGIIKDSKEESNKRSVEAYARALKNSIAKYQLDGKELGISQLETIDGRNFSNKNDFKVDYDGNVVCEVIEIYADGTIYLEKCKVNGEVVKYTYGKKASFADDSWNTIVANVKAGYMYNVGETKEIKLEGFTNEELNSNGLYTVRIANNTSPEECTAEGFSQTACGFVVEFADIITEYRMNSDATNIGGWRDCDMRKYVNEIIYNSLPKKVKDNISVTFVVSSYGQSEPIKMNFITKDKLYLLSTKEVWGKEGQSFSQITDDKADNQTRQLDYYKDIAKVTIDNYSGTVKNYNRGLNYWWLRSIGLSYPNSFYNVNASHKAWNNKYANDISGVAPAFRIG